jgi:hypothetical protein
MPLRNAPGRTGRTLNRCRSIQNGYIPGVLDSRENGRRTRNSQRSAVVTIMIDDENSAAALSPLQYIREVVPPAVIPTIQAIIRSPSLLVRPTTLSRLFFANIWISFGNGVNENSRAAKDILITPNAYGVVLDIGAGNTVFCHCHFFTDLKQKQATDIQQIIWTTSLSPSILR